MKNVLPELTYKFCNLEYQDSLKNSNIFISYAY